MSQLIKPNHVILTSSNDINDICKPLFDKTDVNYFTFARSFQDGSRFSLTTNPHGSEYFFNHKHYKNLVVKSNSKQPTTSYALWITFKHNELYSDMINIFNINNGITIAKQRKRFADYYYFGSTTQKHHLNNFYLNNMDVFELFILYFHDRAHELIQLSLTRSNRIRSPDIKNTAMNESSIIAENEGALINLNDFAINNMFIDDYGTHLTKREIDCAVRILLGESASEIAENLHISERTVNIHTGNLKSKLHCNKKSELIKKLFELGLDKLSGYYV